MSEHRNTEEKIIITKIRPQISGQDRLFCCLLQNEKLIEAVCAQASGGLRPGEIRLGRVQKVLKGLNAAFVEVQPGAACYLPLEKAKHPVFSKKMPSEKVVQGDELLVQITKEADGTKLAAATTNLSFSGHYLVVTNENRFLSFSKKLTDGRKAELKQLLTAYDAYDPQEFGLIVRTNAQGAPDEAILQEYKALAERMKNLLRTARYRTCYTCFTPEAPFYLSYLKNAYTDRLTEIVTDDPDVYRELADYICRYPDCGKIALRFADTDYPLSKAYNLEREIERALSRIVHLPCGGYLVIDPTEAMTVIDVNSGKSTGTKDKAKHFAKVNREAAAEIARQLRLRGLSGIIIADFINMETDEERTDLLHYLRACLSRDPVPTQVVDITKLGLVEITRRKSVRSLKEQLQSKTDNP